MVATAGSALREGWFAEIDVENLADEIEDVGKAEKRELAEWRYCWRVY